MPDRPAPPPGPLPRRVLVRRSAIEPGGGHMKTDGRLARYALKGRLGDALHAVLCRCCHNIRMIRDHFRALWAEIMATLIAIFGTTSAPSSAKSGFRTPAACCLAPTEDTITRERHVLDALNQIRRNRQQMLDSEH